VGCGTGRHWQELFAKDPRLIIGFDVSEGMLAILKNKYPDAIIYKHTDNQLSMLCNRYCDLIISTLTLAHIDNIAEVFKEWDRVLKPGGSLIITDYHCEALLKGASRTFRNKNKLIAIKSHIYPIKQIMQIADSSGISQIQFCERKIDELVKHYYTKQNADHLYQHFYGTPIIYGIHFKKGYAFS
jgi:ubiquinone/menaquinone biosynthesis C-methylase UbiE